METAEEVAEGSVWVCCGVRGWTDGWGRGQAFELTDLEDYIKTTQLPIMGRREEATKTRGCVLRENIFTSLCHVMSLLCIIISF